MPFLGKTNKKTETSFWCSGNKLSDHGTLNHHVVTAASHDWVLQANQVQFIPGAGAGKRLSLSHWWAAGLAHERKQKRDFHCSGWSESSNYYFLSPFLCILGCFHSEIEAQMVVLQLPYHRSTSARFLSHCLKCWFLRHPCKQIAA